MTNKKRILYTATSDIHLNTFHIPYLKWLKSEGFEIHLAFEKRGEIDFSFCDFTHHIVLSRSPFSVKNIQAFKMLYDIIRKYQFTIIHCHTPAVSALTRLASISARRKGAKVLYTAHGFHFFKGAPLKYWLIFYPAEKILSAVTDGIITINEEDYMLIQKKFWNRYSFRIKGVGVDPEKFRTVHQEERLALRRKYGFKDDDFILIYIAEFIQRKNHKFIIQALPELKKNIPNLKVLFVGRGLLMQHMQNLSTELHVHEITAFLGWRNDVGDLAALSDIGISSSKQEGLGLGLAEEMLCSLPIVASVDRGHREMVEHGKNGYLFQQNNTDEFIRYITNLYNNKKTFTAFAASAREKAQEFLLSGSLESMKNIYRKFYSGKGGALNV